MKLNYKDFHNAICNLKKFMKEQEKLDNVIKVISPSGTNVCEFGNEFIENYIDLLEKSVNDELKLIGWFVFDNNFGKNKLTVSINNKEYIISSEKKLFDIYIKTLNYD